MPAALLAVRLVGAAGHRPPARARPALVRSLRRLRLAGVVTDNPLVNLDFRTAFCDRHREPLRAEWPKGAALAMLGLFNAIVADERVVAMLPKDAEGKADTYALDGVLTEVGPFCCFLGDAIAGEVVALALDGRVWGIPGPPSANGGVS